MHILILTGTTATVTVSENLTLFFSGADLDVKLSGSPLLESLITGVGGTFDKLRSPLFIICPVGVNVSISLLLFTNFDDSSGLKVLLFKDEENGKVLSKIPEVFIGDTLHTSSLMVCIDIISFDMAADVGLKKSRNGF